MSEGDAREVEAQIAETERLDRDIARILGIPYAYVAAERLHREIAAFCKDLDSHRANKQSGVSLPASTGLSD